MQMILNSSHANNSDSRAHLAPQGEQLDFPVAGVFLSIQTHCRPSKANVRISYQDWDSGFSSDLLHFSNPVVELSPWLQMVSGFGAGLEFEARTEILLLLVSGAHTTSASLNNLILGRKCYTEFLGLQAKQCHKPVDANKPKQHSCLSTIDPGRTHSQSNQRQKTTVLWNAKTVGTLEDDNQKMVWSDSLRPYLFGTSSPQKCPQVSFNLIVYVT